MLKFNKMGIKVQIKYTSNTIVYNNIALKVCVYDV